MRNSVIAILALLFTAGVVFQYAGKHSTNPETEFMVDPENSDESQFSSNMLKDIRMNISSNLIDSWTWKGYADSETWVNVVDVIGSFIRDPNTKAVKYLMVNAVFNASGLLSVPPSRGSQSGLATVFIPWPAFPSEASVHSDSHILYANDFIRLYTLNVVLPFMVNNTMKATEISEVNESGSLRGLTNLNIWLPSVTVTSPTHPVQINFHNATFSGNSTSDFDFRGIVYAQYSAKDLNSTTSIIFGYITYEVYDSHSYKMVFDESTLGNDSYIRDVLSSYFLNYSHPAILQAINVPSISHFVDDLIPVNDSSVTGNQLCQNQPGANGFYDNEVCKLVINEAYFTGRADEETITGVFWLRFDVYGENMTNPSEMIWEKDVIATVQFRDFGPEQFVLNRELAIKKSDVELDLFEWYFEKLRAFLLTNETFEG